MFDNFVGYPNELAVEAPDATTLTFKLKAPCAYIEGLFAFPTFFPVKQAAVEANADWQTSQAPGAITTQDLFPTARLSAQVVSRNFDDI